MATIRLHVVKPASQTESIPGLTLEGLPLARWFADATGDRLTLRLVHHQVDFDPCDCDSARLHDVAAAVLPANPVRPTNDIVLIFARSWLAPGVQLYGLMFDYDGIEPSIGVAMTSRGIPRQACAVFLDAFADSATDAIVHTAIHELGHIFNLQHDPSQSSFMGDRVFASGFTGLDCQRLTAAADRHWDYVPGGANFSAFESGARRAPGARAASGVVLSAAPGRASYLVGEPIVLDLELKPTGARRIRVPDELDPGYPTLRIWYENPLGEVQLYRSRNLYCRAPQRRRQISRADPLRNNPKISLGRSGPTMLIPGTYRVWAEFGGVPGRYAGVVRSRPQRFAVRAPRNQVEFDVSAVLRQPGVAACIVDKGGRLRRRERRLLESVIQRHPHHAALRYARYALAVHYERSRQLRRAAQLVRGLSLPAGQTAERARRLRADLRRRRA